MGAGGTAGTDPRTGRDQGRFELREELGRGAMGVVYRAYDRERRTTVALKTLRSIDGAALYRFKQEFRALAGIDHPNLVTLYELQSSGDAWFFTMELVEGVSLLEYVRPFEDRWRQDTASVESPLLRTDAQPTAAIPPAAVPTTSSTDTLATMDSAPDAASAGVPHRREHIERAVLDEERLRAALPQLVAAVSALHAEGKLHRDLKPSNILVDGAGRVVVCDFGLVIERSHGEGAGEVVGTPAYMAPEQVDDRPVEASDWYSLGCVLYEALTGRLPFTGTALEVLRAKSRMPAPSLAGDPALPADLAGLCDALLHRDPGARPAGDELRALLAGSRAPEPAAPIADPVPFVGRAELLRELHDSMRGARAGRAVAALVHGPSSMGKSALVGRFLDEVRRTQPECVVLEGRCYERESVPYQALDTVIDALTEHLLRRSPDELSRLLPPNASALARLFPVLTRVPALAQQPRDDRAAEPQEARREAFDALRSLLQRVAEDRPLILFIDDLQWGDVDSTGFLLDLIHHPSAPRLLLVATYRSEEVDTSPLLRGLLPRLAAGFASNVRSLAVGPLSSAEAEALVQAVAAEAPAAAIARDGGGNPFFIAELARASRVRGPDVAGDSLDALLLSRIERLDDESLALLSSSAVAARPLPFDIVARAARLEQGAAALARLQAERLVRTRDAGDVRLIEPYHDRIRETAVRRLGEPQLRTYHRRIARALEAANRRDDMALVEHWRGAGVLDRAAEHAAGAAQRAEASLAFDRAAYAYRVLLEIAELSPPERAAVRGRLGDALANAGSLREAARSYLDATVDATPVEAVELRRRAIEQLLRGGELEEGLAQARILVGEVGLPMPASRRRALLMVAVRRARLAMRGLAHEPRTPDEVAPEVASRLAVGWSLSSSLSLVDPMLAMSFQMRLLLESLDVGCDRDASMALSLEVGFVGTAGQKKRARLEAVCTRALELAEQSGDPVPVGFAVAMRGFGSFMLGDFDAGYRDLSAGEKTMLEHATGLRWQLDVCQIYRMAALFYRGQLRELINLVPVLLRAAEDRGDEYLASALRCWRTNIVWLAIDDAAAARAHLAARPSRDDAFHLHDYFQMLSAANIELYEGDAAAAWAGVAASWRRLKRSMLLRVQSIRIEADFLRGRCALAAADATSGRERGRLLQDARRAAAAIERERTHWGQPLAALLRAGLALRAGRPGQARDLLEAAERAAAAADMRLFEIVARWSCARLPDQHDGGATERALAELTAEDVREPARFAAIWSPQPPG